MGDGLGHAVKVDARIDIGDAARQAGPCLPVEAGGGGGGVAGFGFGDAGGGAARRLGLRGGFGGRLSATEASSAVGGCDQRRTLSGRGPRARRSSAVSGGRRRLMRATDRHEDDEAAGLLHRAGDGAGPSPEPKKMSPRAGPTIAEPVSWAIISRRNGAAVWRGSASTKTGVWKVCSVRSTARLRPASAAPRRRRPGRAAGSSTGASRKKM